MTRTTSSSLVAADGSATPIAAAYMGADMIAKKPSPTKQNHAKKNDNKDPVSKKRSEPKDNNPKAATRFRAALVEAKAPAAAAAETAVSTSVHQSVELMIMSTDAQVVLKGLCGLLEAMTEDTGDRRYQQCGSLYNGDPRWQSHHTSESVFLDQPFGR